MKKLTFLLLFFVSNFVFSQQVSLDKDFLVKYVNELRAKGCYCGEKYYSPAPPLVWNDTLEKAALLHSKDMVENNYFSHKNLKGEDPGDRLEKLNYQWISYGENIQSLFLKDNIKLEKEIIDFWMTSPGHCSNIMEPKFKKFAVGSYLKGQMVYSTMVLSD